jgi:7 transmembrane sweet-taste receptor of 3 GCPR
VTLTLPAFHPLMHRQGVPWLWSIGFTLVFSALFSKTWRINQVFRTSNSHYSRAKVSEKEMLIPFAVLMSINVAILIAWTVVDPLQYRREADIARDEWNRVIATYGVCKSDNASAFLLPLLVINAFVLILANWQAYEARHIQAEFAESKYIAICMFSMLQAMVSGVPVLFFVRDLPRAYYMVFVLLCFIIGMVILLVMFVPKVIFTHQFLQMSPALQKQYLADAVGKSTKRPPTKKYVVNGQSSGPSTVRVSTMSDGGHGMVVRKNNPASMFPLPEQYPEEPDEPNTNPYSISGQSEENGGNNQGETKFERPVDVLKNRQTGGWAGMTLTQVLPNEPIEEENDESHGDIEGDIEGGDRALPLPFERPVDVLKNNRETTGWGGITTSEIAATSEVLGNDNEPASESQDDDAEGCEDDQASPMRPFERPVDVLRDNRETTGWGGATLSEVIN